MSSSTTSTFDRAREFDAQIRRARIDIHDRRAEPRTARLKQRRRAIAFVATDDDDSEFVWQSWRMTSGRRHCESRSSLADSSGRAV